MGSRRREDGGNGGGVAAVAWVPNRVLLWASSSMEMRRKMRAFLCGNRSLGQPPPDALPRTSS